MKLNLKKLRNSMRLTQQEVADRLGITRQAYSNYENGKREPSFGTMIELSQIFDVNIFDLFDREDYHQALSKEFRSASFLNEATAAQQLSFHIAMSNANTGREYRLETDGNDFFIVLSENERFRLIGDDLTEMLDLISNYIAFLVNSLVSRFPDYLEEIPTLTTDDN